MLHPGDPQFLSFFNDFVEHPRFGLYPILTGLNPPPADRLARSQKYQQIPGTAILADVARQSRSWTPVRAYSDEIHQCQSCGQYFLFFAQEQQWWYEELKFNLFSDCQHCTECRRAIRHSRAARQRFDSLTAKQKSLSFEEGLEASSFLLMLLEDGRIWRSQKNLDRIRWFLNHVPEDKQVLPDALSLRERMRRLRVAPA